MERFLVMPSPTPAKKGTSICGMYKVQGLAAAELERHKKQLTLRLKNMRQTGGEPTILATWAEPTEGLLEMPLFYGLQHFGQPEDATAHDEGTELMRSEVSFCGSLREDQRAAVAAVEEAWAAGDQKLPHGGLLSLPCGFGKTVLALYLASRLRLRTLVLVHTSMLLDQWEQRASQFLPAATIGRLQQKRADLQADVCIGMIQSVVSRNYPEQLLRGVGLVVVDEAHHVAAPLFSQAMRKMRASRLLGLSATLRRKDGSDPLLGWLLGPVLYEAAREPTEVAVRLVPTSHRPSLRSRPDGSINLDATLTTVSRSRLRNALIAKIILQCFQEGHATIVLSDRIAQLEMLRSLLQTLPAGGREASAAARYYIGRTKAAERREAEQQAPIILSSYAMSKEALDIPRLSCLIMATPKGDVVQAVGRILRPFPAKRTPLVIDLHDEEHELLSRLAAGRCSYYHRQGWDVQKQSFS